MRGHRPYGHKRHVRNEDILLDMRIAAQACPRGELSQLRYDLIGRHSATMVNLRFGSWRAAMDQAFPELVERRAPTVDQMIADLHRVADILRAARQDQEQVPRRQRLRTLSIEFYAQHGKYGHRYVDTHLPRALGVTTWKQMKAAITGLEDV